jgi:hypothetical protein
MLELNKKYDFYKEGSAKQANDVAVKTIQSEKRFLRRVLGDVDMAVDIETTVKAAKPAAPKKKYTPKGFRTADNAGIRIPYVDNFARKPAATEPKKPNSTYSSFRRADIAKVSEVVEENIARCIF